ncbi:BON1-associated 2 -like protein [Gossypium arboreum]|uniref:BON1-associated 2-like protein n=1 Tax=Gossypium arboreum TaxID=29729 RepID=A0A0B0PAJ6_GOSAR|nr:BON1-associated 2 -like protein [Gossypium arboreum]
MGKIWIEVCIISARGLRRSSSFWKLQWFTVGWIDPDNKYCTKIDASGSSNPVWKTKFAALVDESNIQDMVLHVEVYSREPIFLREKLQGTASVALKEFLAKYNNNSTSSSEEVGSYQLRKRNSNKPQGFVDISIRISEERENPASLPGNDGGLVNIPFPYKHPVPYPTSNYNPSLGEPSASGPGYRPPRSATPPPPPPPSHVGYIPTFLPRTETYMNMPSSVGAGVGPRPGFAMGVGAGALAAGAVLFGDDFMSGFDVSAGFQDPTLAISTDPPF